MSQQEKSEQPQVITLDSMNSSQILSQYIEVAQKHDPNPFTLPEADILKRCRDVLLNGQEDPEIKPPQARQLFMQAVSKGQSKGAWNLDDASILHKVCQYVTANLSDTVQKQVQADDEDNDLSSLSQPVPLKNPGLRSV